MSTTIDERTCSHHWLIDTPNGTYSGGRCKRCGVTREFRNSTEEMQWDKDNFSLKGPRRTRRAS